MADVDQHDVAAPAVRRTAAGRALAVLEAFGADHRVLTLSEISRRSGLALTTAHRLVGELCQWGALERDDDGRYAIGLRLLELTALAPRGLQLRECALPFLDDLHHATRANVHLSVLDGSEVVYVEALRARGAVAILSRLGGRWPAHATGTGQVLLAHAVAEAQEVYLRGPIARFTDHTLTDPKVLRAKLAEVRSCGFVIAASQLTAGATAVAVPIRGSGDEVVAAVGVTAAAAHDPRMFLPALTATARGISRALRAPSALRPAAERRIDPPASSA